MKETTPLDFVNSGHIITTAEITCCICYKTEDQCNTEEHDLAEWLSLNGWILDKQDEPRCPKCISKRKKKCLT